MKPSAIHRGAAISNQVAQINRSRREPSYEPFVSYDPKTGVSLYKVPKAQSAPSEEQRLRKKGDSIDLYQNKKELEEDELLDHLEDEYDEDYEEDEEGDDDEDYQEDEEEEEDDFIVDDDEELEYDEDGIDDELDEAERILALKKKAKLEPFKRVVTYYRRKDDGKLEAVPESKSEPEKSNVEEKKPEEQTTNAQQ